MKSNDGLLRRAVRAAVDVAGFAMLAAWSVAPVAADALGVGLTFHGGLVAGLAALLAAWLLWGDPGRTVHRALSAACAVAAVAGSIAMNAGVVVPPWSAIATVAAGAATAYISLRWVARLGTRPLRDALVLMLLGFAVSSVVRLAFFAAIGRVAMANILVTALCGVLAVMLLGVDVGTRARSEGGTDEQVRDASGSDDQVRPFGNDRGRARGGEVASRLGRPVGRGVAGTDEVRGADADGLAGRRGLLRGTLAETIGYPSLAEVAFYGLVMGFLRTDLVALLGTSGMMAAGSVVKAVVVLALCANVAFVGRRHGRDGSSTHAFLGVCSVVALAFVFFGGSRQAAIALIASVVSFLAVVLVYLRTIDIAGRSDAPPVAVFCSLRLAFEFAILVGLAAHALTGDAAGAWPGTAENARDVLYFAVSSMAVLLLLSMARINAPEPSAHALHGSDRLDLTQRCAKVAADHGLTEREAQVMGLICEGLTNRQIGERIYLTEATVRYHTKRFYKKLGVHNRQELVTLVLAGEGAR